MPNAELTPKQQWSELVKKSQSILIVTHRNPDGDALGSILALAQGLKKLGKEVTISAEGDSQDPLDFLPGFSDVTPQITARKDLLVVLDESQAKIGNIALKRIAENKLVVVITPKDGTLTSANVRLEDGSYNVDLIVVLDSSNLERLGSIYDDNTSLFYEVPVVNIDHHADNNNFGKVNIVDITASSTAEILVSLLETIGKDTPGMIDADIATCLLTGITTDTGSFQNSNTTPKSLTVAAQMVAAGARQQEIIRHIFKTRSLSTLRLWGRALSYLKEDSNLHFVWSVLSKADFVAAQAKTEEASGVIDELLKTASNQEFVLLLSERPTGLHGSFRAIAPTRDVSQLAALFAGGGHPQAAAFTLPGTTLKEKEQEIIQKIRSFLDGKQSESPVERIKPSETTSSTPEDESPEDAVIGDEKEEATEVIEAPAPRPMPGKNATLSTQLEDADLTSLLSEPEE